MTTERKTRKLKDDNEVAPITLLMRQYYNNPNHLKKQAEKKERYQNDEKYREAIKLKSLIAYYKKKEKQLEAQIS